MVQGPGHHRLPLSIFCLKESEADPGSCYAFVAMGNVSFCNHSKGANCHFDIDEDRASSGWPH
jgi:hypothetical protein